MTITIGIFGAAVYHLMEGNCVSGSPPPAVDICCANELNRSSSDASALTAEICEDILHHSPVITFLRSRFCVLTTFLFSLGWCLFFSLFFVILVFDAAAVGNWMGGILCSMILL